MRRVNLKGLERQSLNKNDPAYLSILLHLYIFSYLHELIVNYLILLKTFHCLRKIYIVKLL